MTSERISKPTYVGKMLQTGLLHVISALGKLSKFSQIASNKMKIEFCAFALELCKLIFLDNKNSPHTMVGYGAYELLHLGKYKRACVRTYVRRVRDRTYMRSCELCVWLFVETIGIRYHCDL